MAKLNIGMITSADTGKKPITMRAIMAALAFFTVDVLEVKTAQSASEPTLIPTLDRALTEKELTTLCVILDQDAIAQQHADKTGLLAGPEAADWGGEFIADYFME